MLTTFEAWLVEWGQGGGFDGRSNYSTVVTKSVSVRSRTVGLLLNLYGRISPFQALSSEYVCLSVCLSCTQN